MSKEPCPVCNEEQNDAHYVAFESGTENIISKGNDASKVVEEAKETGKDFIFSYVPEHDQTYIF